MNGHDVLARLSRHERRQALKDAARARKSGAWGDWETFRFPKGTVGSGWSYDFDTIHRNAVFSVLDRTLENQTRHLAVTSLSMERPTWWEMQRIKNELAGETVTAIEVYPPQAKVVDGAHMYHIWVLPNPLDFGLWRQHKPTSH